MLLWMMDRCSRTIRVRAVFSPLDRCESNEFVATAGTTIKVAALFSSSIFLAVQRLPPRTAQWRACGPHK